MLGGGERRPPSLGRSLLAEPLLHARACSCRAPWQQCTQPTAMRCRRDAPAAPLGLRRAHRHLHRRHLRHMRRLVQRVCARHAWHWHGAAGAHCGAAGAMQQANGRGVRQAHRSRRAVRAAPAPSTLLVAASRPPADWLGHHLPAGQGRALTWQVAAWISSEWAARAARCARPTAHLLGVPAWDGGTRLAKVGLDRQGITPRREGLASFC